MQVADINEHHPAIIVELPGEAHVISMVTVRQLAAGYQYHGDSAKLVQILAAAVRDLIE